MKRIAKDCLVHSYGPDNPVRLRVTPGEVFVVETHDRFAGWLDSPEAPDLSNPSLMGVTGAVAVEGAEPGDLLAVDVLEVHLTCEFGMVNAIPGKGAFARHVERFQTRRVPIAADTVELAGVRVPLRLRRGLDPVEAGMLISVAADLGVAQIVNPLVTAKVAIPRVILDLG